ncbi:Polyubiquitin-D [Tetrabaena socialis]|uniref:Polyubiquitin-D n=1 Tax=Tetrabaena socialis TaxID=47790 RepID=A0A2J8ABX1_9CHLO|nr:Polyubiquitin-D [Tetrabaena socialis]|eukprot:PNH10019.1 Polyubiquitin-D [Tetrabaena socialis]
MRVFVRDLGGSTVAVDAGGSDGLEQLHAALEARLGVPAQEQVLTTLGGRPLRPAGGGLRAQGVREADTLQLSARLRGGQPVKVRLLTPTPQAESGTHVTVEMEADTPMHAVKARLAAATGLAVEHQRVLLAGMGDMVLADKRTNIGVSYCGSTNNLYFATLPATEAPVERKAA